MPGLLRLACLAASALVLGIPRIAAACSIAPPPPPPPRTAAESASDFAARSSKWYSDIAEQERQQALPGRVAREDRLWATAQRVVLARIEKVGSIRLRGSERQWFKSPLVTLRPLKWLRGKSSVRQFGVHYLSDDSCEYGGAGDAPDGGVGEVFLLFYGPGPLDPRNVLDTIGRSRTATPRSREAFALAARDAAE